MMMSRRISSGGVDAKKKPIFITRVEFFWENTYFFPFGAVALVHRQSNGPSQSCTLGVEHRMSTFVYSFVPLSMITCTESALPSYFSLSILQPISMLFVIDRSCRQCRVISAPISRICRIIRNIPLTGTRYSTYTKEPLLLGLERLPQLSLLCGNISCSAFPELCITVGMEEEKTVLRGFLSLSKIVFVMMIVNITIILITVNVCFITDATLEAFLRVKYLQC